MKIALLMDAALRPTLFSDKVMNRLGEFGQLVVNDSQDTGADTAKRLIQNADVAVTSWGCAPMEKVLLDEAPNLRLVAHAAGSVKGIVSDELYARGIKVCSCARVLSEGVSEMALGLTIAAAKNVFAFSESIHKGGWVTDYSVVTEMFGITVGIVGFGYAGRHFAELLRPFGVQALVFDPYVTGRQVAAVGAEKVELDELLRRSDVVSLHAADVPATRHMINRETIAHMKDGAIFINTARGALVDEAALAEALLEGKFKYACLDVTDPEPPAPDSPLRGIPNCILTPHIAGLANNGKLKIGAHVAEEIARLMSGEPLTSEVTKEMLATMA